jgi:serine/threonine-protein kinase
MTHAPGTKFGPYEILAPIGIGGMGAVYKARDGRLGRTVAIKFLKAEHAERFEREARAIAALNHSHICTLHDVGPDYLVMEYVEGTPVCGPLPVDQAVRQALEIASALDAAHHKGIVHRDLKPANIMLTSAGIKLLDFGLAKLAQVDAGADATVTQTQAGMIVGTAAYMSPEQAEGKPADARSDIFSFGLVLYEMLSGRRAFAGETSVSTMAAILHKEPDPIAAPPELMKVVTRCIRKSPADRFQTISEVRAAIEAAGLHAAEPKPVSIAVLPFSNMSGDPENEYFSDGLAEEIINALTKLPGLKVTSRTSAFAFKGRHEDIRKIGEMLSVGHILEGSVRKAGSRVRITAQLISVADGCHLWSDRYDREMIDIFAVQDEISQAIVDVLKVKLGRSEQVAVRRQTENLSAYQSYLEGRYHYQQMSPSDVARGRACFERAIELDPTYAAPYASLAECHIYASSLERKPLAETVLQANAAAEKAIQLDPAGAEGYVARGFVRCAFEFQWQEGERDYQKALQLNPESSIAHYRRATWYLMPMGRHDEAHAAIERAVELEPLGVLVRSVEPLVLHSAGRKAEAVRQARTARQLFPSSYLCSWVAAIVFAGCECFPEALDAINNGLHLLPGNPFLETLAAIVHARLGQGAEVSAIRKRLNQYDAGGGYVPRICLGLLDVIDGETERGFQLLEDAVDERHVFTIPCLCSPAYTQFLAGPRYDMLLRKMNLR